MLLPECDMNMKTPFTVRGYVKTFNTLEKTMNGTFKFSTCSKILFLLCCIMEVDLSFALIIEEWYV